MMLTREKSALFLGSLSATLLIFFSNESLILKFGWSLFSSNDQWARLCRHRFLRCNYPIVYYVKSSIWARIKHFTDNILDNSIWLIGDGTRIGYWTDNWLGVTLVEALDISVALRQELKEKVSNSIHEGTWTILPLVDLFGPWLVDEILNITLPVSPTEDCFVWKHSKSVDLSSKEAYEHLYPPGPVLPWASTIWKTLYLRLILLLLRD
jgi:hypothetical protein